jgi:NADP-dependent 3-hydroxy acid dehydrogenase YdfG
MSARIRDKVILITGASSGIGEAAAKRLAGLGAQVCLVARRQDELQRVKAQIEADGGRAAIYPADLSSEAGGTPAWMPCWPSTRASTS